MDIRTMERKEKKYILSIPLYLMLSRKSQAILESDSHNKGSGYLVRSLYFDTMYNEDFFDQLESLEHRRKIRLRMYPPDFTGAQLEIKEKSGENQIKRSISMSRSDAQKLIDGKYEVLLGYDNELAAELYYTMTREGYFPKSIVEYNRIAYFAPCDVRITFDCDIRGCEANLDLFDEHLPLTPIFMIEDVVLEVKYKQFMLEYVRDILGMNHNPECSVSKYGLSRRAFLT